VLEEHFSLMPLDADYVRLRLVKSEEEIGWLRKGAALSDAGFKELLEKTAAGMTERELANLVERAYVGQGGTTFIHYIGVTSMAEPHLCVPPQFASSRKTRVGDVVFCELSASWWDYPGQVLRSFTVGPSRRRSTASCTTRRKPPSTPSPASSATARRCRRSSTLPA
jgi:Xaa-Pro aminopeptidase